MKIAVGLSGGVDSSVVAAMLKSQGHDVVGITMKIWDPKLDLKLADKEIKGGACYGPDESEDIEACERLAKKLEIPYYVFDLSKEYTESVIEYFKSEYSAGRTPNPCVRCNSVMKFGFLLESARKVGIDFDKFATGHYARIEDVNGVPTIKRAKDLKKDQSYFIHRVPTQILKDVIFPLGDSTKTEVREMAQFFELEMAEKPESQDFIAGGDYTVLFGNSMKPGEIVDENGCVLGQHDGIINYTVGQRRGINVGSTKPLFVKAINAKKNQIIVTDNERLFTHDLTIVDYRMNWLDFDHEKYFVQIRQNHKAEPVEFIFPRDKEMVIEFKDPIRAVTPGQSAVVYNSSDVVVGYGIIQ